MISSMSFANTIDIKEIDNSQENATLVDNKEADEALRICYERSRSTIQDVSGVYVTTVNYTCYDHPEMPGKGTVYINAN
jgi:hypothetical protein